MSARAHCLVLSSEATFVVVVRVVAVRLVVTRREHPRHVPAHRAHPPHVVVAVGWQVEVVRNVTDHDTEG